MSSESIVSTSSDLDKSDLTRIRKFVMAEFEYLSSLSVIKFAEEAESIQANLKTFFDDFETEQKGIDLHILSSIIANFYERQ